MDPTSSDIQGHKPGWIQKAVLSVEAAVAKSLYSILSLAAGPRFVAVRICSSTVPF